MHKVIKYIQSFFKKEWSFEDYPITVTQQESEKDTERWRAMIEGWPGLVGLGSSELSARNELNKAFDDFVKKGSTLPRPGTQKKIEFASTIGLEQYPELYREFVEDILGFDPDGFVFISDQSSLWDFVEDENLNSYFDRVFQKYQLDVSKVEDGNILQIIRCIEQHKR